MAKIKDLQTGVEQEFELAGGKPLSIGRKRDCDLVFPPICPEDQSLANQFLRETGASSISRKHGVISQENGDTQFVNAGSLGTFYKGRKEDVIKLNDGDIFTLGPDGYEVQYID